MKTLFYRYNPWWEGVFLLDGIYERPHLLNTLRASLDTKHICFLTGLRRVGKTTLLRLLIQFLVEQKHVDPHHIFFISLDDYTLFSKTILEIVEEYRRLHGIPFEQKIYLFFDEITFQKNYEQQLKNLYDTQQVKIFATSSSASLLKKGKPFLTGRSTLVEVLPLSFEEYLVFKGIKISPSNHHLKEKHFEEYLFQGGIPQYVLTGDMEYLKELVDDIIMKDIAAAYGVRNPQILKDYFLMLMERAGKQMSLNKIARVLGISPDSAKRYLHMFEETYLIHLVSRYGKTNETLLSQKKIYAADLGIKTLFTGKRDKGALFENYVYFHLKKKNPRYLKEQDIEIDFMTDEKTLVEVKYGQTMTDKQQSLFNRTHAKKKLVIQGMDDVDKLLNL